MLLSIALFAIVLQLEFRRCAAVNDPHEIVEDLTHLPPPDVCPEFIGWPQVPMPVSCDDPACHGISSGPNPYRCRQQGGIMHGVSVFGCPCCPRLIDCEDPRCGGLASEEVCQTSLLKLCVCVSSSRRTLASASPQLRDGGAIKDQVSTESESLDDEIAALNIVSDATCPRHPPVRCIDKQCRGKDDWKTQSDLSLTPRCNRVDGKIFIDGVETVLSGCPCCPEYIACSSNDCNGDANQVCTSVPLHGCFCDWPGRIMIQYIQEQWQPQTDDLINIDTFDQLFHDPDFDPDQFMAEEFIDPTTPHSSMNSENRATRTTDTRATATSSLSNSTWTDLLLNQNDMLVLPQGRSGTSRVRSNQTDTNAIFYYKAITHYRKPEN